MPNKRFDTRSALLLLEDEDDVLQEIEEDGLYYPSFGEEENFVSLYVKQYQKRRFLLFKYFILF